MQKWITAVLILAGAAAVAGERVKFDAQFDAETQEGRTVSFTFVAKANDQVVELEPRDLGALVGVKRLWRGEYSKAVPFRGGTIPWRLVITKSEALDGTFSYWVQAMNGNHVPAGLAVNDIHALNSVMANGASTIMDGKAVVGRFIATFK